MLTWPIARIASELSPIHQISVRPLHASTPPRADGPIHIFLHNFLFCAEIPSFALVPFVFEAHHHRQRHSGVGG
jgi:hypothetical protein